MLSDLDKGKVRDLWQRVVDTPAAAESLSVARNPQDPGYPIQKPWGEIAQECLDFPDVASREFEGVEWIVKLHPRRNVDDYIHDMDVIIKSLEAPNP